MLGMGIAGFVVVGGVVLELEVVGVGSWRLVAFQPQLAATGALFAFQPSTSIHFLA